MRNAILVVRLVGQCAHCKARGRPGLRDFMRRRRTAFTPACRQSTGPTQLGAGSEIKAMHAKPKTNSPNSQTS